MTQYTSNYGILHNYTTGHPLRPATRSELYLSVTESTGTGAFSHPDYSFPVYVTGESAELTDLILAGLFEA